MTARPARKKLVCAAALAMLTAGGAAAGEHSVARMWNEALLDAIRRDYATPTIHARNLYHTSAAMFDAWAAFDPHAVGVFTQHELIATDDAVAAQEQAISFAAFRLIHARFGQSPGANQTMSEIHSLMATLGYDVNDTSLLGDSPAAVGNRCALKLIAHGFQDGANQHNGYLPPMYSPVNPPMVVDSPGTSGIFDPNRWQPLSLAFFLDQFGNPLPWNHQLFLTPHWGHVHTFSLTEQDMHPDKPGVYFDPGMPPQLGGEGHDEYRDAFVDVLLKSAMLDPDIDLWIDISPASLGNNSLGANDGTGYDLNPVTDQPYEPNVVRVGDFMRVLSEFWADGPGTEAPPGHWNVIANDVSYHPQFQRRIGGIGPLLSPLEWDIKLYLALNGAVHDAGVACWGVKGHYDYVRPISAIRHMAELGQSTDPTAPSYHPHGLPLIPNFIELITEETAAPGGRHSEVAEQMVDEFGKPVFDSEGQPVLVNFVGELAVRAWPGAPADAETHYSGVRWVRGQRWVPYQLPTFVSPPFAGYTSGHSTFSRAAAEVLTHITGSAFFPGGMGSYTINPGWLHFEYGPSQPVQLQWARYYDASDQSAVSRIYGGIHPWIDDFPARIMGSTVGIRAWQRAKTHYGMQQNCAADLTGSDDVGVADLLALLSVWGPCEKPCPADLTGDGTVNVADVLELLAAWGPCESE